MEMPQLPRRFPQKGAPAQAEPPWLSFFGCMTDSVCCEADAQTYTEAMDGGVKDRPSTGRRQHEGWGDMIQPIGMRRHVVQTAFTPPAGGVPPLRATCPPARLSPPHPVRTPWSPATSEAPHSISGLLPKERIECQTVGTPLHPTPTTHQSSRMVTEHHTPATWEELEERLHRVCFERTRFK